MANELISVQDKSFLYMLIRKPLACEIYVLALPVSEVSHKSILRLLLPPVSLRNKANRLFEVY